LGGKKKAIIENGSGNRACGTRKFWSAAIH
jgi:hypothetical protein